MQAFQCITCKHYQMFGECKAFPTGIPEEIFNGGFNHENPYKGDNGIRYQSITQKQDELDEYISKTRKKYEEKE